MTGRHPLLHLLALVPCLREAPHPSEAAAQRLGPGLGGKVRVLWGPSPVERTTKAFLLAELLPEFYVTPCFVTSMGTTRWRKEPAHRKAAMRQGARDTSGGLV